MKKVISTLGFIALGLFSATAVAQQDGEQNEEPRSEFIEFKEKKMGGEQKGPVIVVEGRESKDFSDKLHSLDKSFIEKLQGSTSDDALE